MRNVIETETFSNASELLTAVQGLINLASEHPETIYTQPGSIYLIEETLTDGEGL